MVSVIRLILALLLLTLPSLYAGCPLHAQEKRMARQRTCDAIVEAQRAGGEILREMITMPYWLQAWNLMENTHNYETMSEVLRDFLKRAKPPGAELLLAGWQDIGTIYLDMYNNCILNHQNRDAYYDRGRLHYDFGRHEECIHDIVTYIDKGGTCKNPKAKLVYGSVLNEVSEYDQALIVLSECINADPSQKEAYAQRAIAYFETGDFDSALADFLDADQLVDLKSYRFRTPPNYSEGLLQGMREGGKESLQEFFPSLWNTAYGIGTTLWTCCHEPLESWKAFAAACHEVTEAALFIARNVDREDIDEECRLLYLEYENLDDFERGRWTGYILGRFGVDAVAASAVVKSAVAIKRLKDANRLCMLETMAASTVNREKIVDAAIRHGEARSTYFKNVKIHWGKQNKHIKGAHNFQKGKSVVTHPDPQKLLDQYAGKGHKANSVFPEASGYKERVDFGEVIGLYVEQGAEHGVETTVGIIHYSKNGAHITPARPN